MFINLLSNAINKFVIENHYVKVFVGQTNLVCTFVYNYNTFIYEIFINKLTEFEWIWMINVISP